MSEDISIEEIRWDEAQNWLWIASADDLRPMARAWLVHQRRSELVTLGLSPEERRVEALRAAARLVAAEGPGEMTKPVAATMEVAEKFARWLETGER